MPPSTSRSSPRIRCCGGTAARRDRVARGDRVDDGAVLDAHRLHEVGAARLVAARDAHAFAQVLLQEAEQQAELRVAGRLADAGGGRRGLRRRRRGPRRRGVDGLQRAAQRRDLARAWRARRPAPRSRLRARAAPRPRAPPPAIESSTAGSKASGWLRGARRDEDARALARAHQAARLELVHRLAHHGARDAVRGGQLLLGGQPVAGRAARRIRSARPGAAPAGRTAARLPAAGVRRGRQACAGVAE